MLRDKINFVIGQMSGFEAQLKNGDSHNCPQIMGNQDFDVENDEIGIFAPK